VLLPLLVLLVPGDDLALAPKLPVGKETTYVTRPLDAEGYIDFEAALNERLGKGVTPEQNANVLIWQAIGPRPDGIVMPGEYFKRLGIPEPPAAGAYFRNLRAYLKGQRGIEADEIDALCQQHDQTTKRPWSKKEYPHIAAWLHANEKPLALVLEASRRPQYFSPLVSPRTEARRSTLLNCLLPNVTKSQELAKALAARAMLRTEEKQFDAAWEDLIACHRIGRLVARGGTLIEAILGMATEQVASEADLAFLERAGLPSEQIRARLRELQNLPAWPPPADKIELTERLVYIDLVQLVRRRGVGVLEEVSLGRSKQPRLEDVRVVEQIDWGPALRSGNRWYNRIVATLRLKDRSVREKELAQIEEDLKKLKQEAEQRGFLAKVFMGTAARGKAIGDILISLLMPALGKVQIAYERVEQGQHNLWVAFALAAYQREHGRYPANLNLLVPKYLSAVPGDLFSGKALVYRPSADGYLLYSVGPNGRDEEGRGPEDVPPGDDPHVRMPLPDLLRKE
jgi:hypothetical protein